MALTFHPVTDKQSWEQYILSRPEANFLQSWNWGAFQEALGKKVFRMAVFHGQQQVGALLAVKETAKRGSYLAIAGGPLINWSELADDDLQAMFDFLKQLGSQEQCAFLRFRPQAIDTPALRQKLSQVRVSPAPMHLTADLTLQLDIRPDESAILAQMRKNTRYEIRRVEKENITTTISQDPADIQQFHEHQLALAKKHNFVPFGYQFLHEQFRVFAADDQAILISSFLGKKLLATAYVLFYNQEAIYHYGISTPDNNRLPGSYACQWAAILEAKRRGCTTYNFWGIAPEKDTNHRFAGVSLFKRGFGGTEVAYLPAHDLPVSPLYFLTRTFESLRRKARHL